MSGSLLLDQIPNDYRTPGTYVRVRPNYTKTGLLDFPAHGLIIAPKLPFGYAAPNRAYPVYSAAQGRYLGGAGSIAAQMVAAWFATNPYTPLDLLCVNDAPNASAARAVLNFTQFTASTPLSVPLRIADTTLRFTLQVGQTTTDLMAMIAIAVASNIDLPVTAIGYYVLNGIAFITLQAKHGGQCGNAIDVEWLTDATAVLPRDAAFYADAAVIGNGRRSTLAGGLGNPDIGAVFPAIASSWYTDIVTPWTDGPNVAEFAAELTRRYTATARQDAHGYLAYAATLSAAISPGLGAVNCPYLSPLPMQGGKSLPWVTAAAMAAYCCYRSSQDPAIQMRGGVLPGILAPDPVDVFNEPEQNLLLHNAGSTYTVKRDGSVLLQRVVTTYLSNDLGAPDTAWLDIMAAKVATRIRWDWRNYVALEYPSNKLTDDGSRAAEYDETIATPNRLLASWIGRTVLYERAGWIENAAVENKDARFWRDPDDPNRCNSKQPYRRIGNLMLLDVDLQFEA